LRGAAISYIDATKVGELWKRFRRGSMNIVAGLIGVSMALLFLGGLAALIHSAPLIVILVVGISLVITDFIGSLRRRDRDA
jgi:hypothetical protein